MPSQINHPHSRRYQLSDDSQRRPCYQKWRNTRFMYGLLYTVIMANCISFAVLSIGHADTALEKLTALPHTGFLLTDETGNTLLAKQQDTAFIPASTTKLVTAWLALSHWGEHYRFSTPVYLDRKTQTLWLKGSGDPFLISEQLAKMAEQIRALNPRLIKRIALDVSLFKPNLVVPGASTTDNPYDAIPSALAANFNTLNLTTTNGKIESAEPQTPLTPFSRSFAGKITEPSLRINTGQRSQDAERYFAELLSELLRAQGVAVEQEIIWGSFPVKQPTFYYQNSQTLGEVVQAMLKYSTNFIANQLVLTLAADLSGSSADFSVVQQQMKKQLRQRFDWTQFTVLEGAGLSRQNQITPRQLIELLMSFNSWEHLLPEVESSIFAKTGTLDSVSSLAGLIRQPDKPKRYFSILINNTAPHRLARDSALELAAQ